MNKVSLAFLITLKCQCAHNINKILVKLLNEYFLIPSSGDQSKCSKEYWDNEFGISLFKDLNEMIILTIDTIFQINNIIPELKSNEPSFLKQLFSMHLYFSNLLEYSKNMKAKNGKDISPENNTSPELNAGKEHNNDPFITNLDLVLYMISQMDNFLDGFKILNCNSRNISHDENNEIATIKSQHQLLTNLNVSIRSIYQEDSMALDINIDVNKYLYDAMLYNLLADHVVEDNNVIILDYLPTEKYFIKYLIKARVKHDIDKPDNEAVSIKDMFEQCLRTYEIEVYYDYVSSIYGVLLKIIYEEINKIIDEIILNKNDTFKKPQYYKTYFSSLTALQTIIDLPIDTISDFKLLSTYGANQIDGAKSIVENRLKLFPHIILLPEKVNYSLEKIVELITDNRFKQFWWIFSTLHLAETRKKSDYVYKTSLKLVSNSIPNNGLNYLYMLHYECETLKNIYYNFFRINLIIDSFKDSISKNLEIIEDDTVFFKIHNYNRILSDHLSKVIEVWSQNENLKLDKDLLKILMTMFIRLKNTKYHIDIHKQNSNEDYKTMILNKNINDLERIGDYIMSLLDNYQIINCKTKKNRYLNYEYFIENTILHHDINKSLLLFNIPIEQDLEDEDFMILDNTEESRSIKYLSEEWYGLLFFVEKNQCTDFIQLILIMNNIHFNCNGYIKPITEQIILSKITLSLNYLVEYASNFFKSIFSSMYFLLIIWYCDPMIFIANDKIILKSIKNELVQELTDFSSLEFPNFCKPYVDFIIFIRDNLENVEKYTRTTTYEIKNLMLTEIEKLGVINVNTTLSTIEKDTKKNVLHIIKEITCATSDLLKALQKYKIMYSGKNPTRYITDKINRI